MTDQSKPLPKSLHTVTAIVRVARYVQSRARPGASTKEAVEAAVYILGYTNVDDPYGLAAAAIKQLEA